MQASVIFFTNLCEKYYKSLTKYHIHTKLYTNKQVVTKIKQSLILVTTCLLLAFLLIYLYNKTKNKFFYG